MDNWYIDNYPFNLPLSEGLSFSNGFGEGSVLINCFFPLSLPLPVSNFLLDEFSLSLDVRSFLVMIFAFLYCELNCCKKSSLFK